MENKIKITGSVGGSTAHERFLKTENGLLLLPVSNDEAEELFGTFVNPEDFGGFES
jgi:hypothetical protein